MKTYLFLANGFEEIEALATVDVLRRAAIDVTTVSINTTEEVLGANDIMVVADTILDDLSDADLNAAQWLILPGGNDGSVNLASDERISALLTAHWKAGRNIAAICAAPAVVLGPLDIVAGRRATCYPTLKEELVAAGATFVDSRVVVDGNLITANGPSSALPFAYAIVREAAGTEVADAVATGMLAINA
jgi:4-methyl-5(b-hydroxyethyl)-thiazole monophosphate biosynthesis